MKYREYKYFVCDFETTVFDNQNYTEVWASAISELGSEDVVILNSIDETYNYFKNLKINCILLYHNLKFDGSFWLDFLLRKKNFIQAINKTGKGELEIEFVKRQYMPRRSFKYSISTMGQWYTLTIKTEFGKIIELRDSLKLLPFSVKKIGKDFKTKHQKLEMEYKGFRYAGCEITDDEKEYIKNDVLVMNEAIQIMHSEGHDKLTIGSCCLEEFIKLLGRDTYELLFPNVYGFGIDRDKYNYENAGFYISKSYRGGWCYLVKGKENKIYNNGITADVNSLYPSVMSGESGNRYPIGLPTFWSGDYIPDEALADDKYFFIRITTEFYLKKDKLPFIQIKGNPLYKGTEMLETSDILDINTGKYANKLQLPNGDIISTAVTLTLTMTDYNLLLEHYDLVNFKILDGCYFNTKIGLFDKYIDKYKKIKIESTGAIKQIAKLFLNNLYGKMATNIDSSFKYALIDSDKNIRYYNILEYQKTPGYIPIGSAITSYARDFTIRHAQMNYYGKDKHGFIYADTDSIHCDLSVDELKGIDVHNSDFLHWKLEASWDIGLFVRQKTYIERVIAEDLEPVEKPFYNIKCAGMPQRCKDLFEMSMKGVSEDEIQDLTEEEKQFVLTKRELSDFKTGLCVPGKLLPKRIIGGIILTDTTYEMR